MEVRMVSSFENHLQKIANSLQLFRYARNFNLLTAEMDGQGSHMAEKQVG